MAGARWARCSYTVYLPRVYYMFARMATEPESVYHGGNETGVTLLARKRRAEYCFGRKVTSAFYTYFDMQSSGMYLLAGSCAIPGVAARLGSSTWYT